MTTYSILIYFKSGVTLTLGNSGSEADWPYQGSIEAAKSFGANMELKVSSFYVSLCVPRGKLSRGMRNDGKYGHVT